MSDSCEDKQFAPTPRKRDLARREGRVARSSHVVSSVVLLTGMTGLRYGGRFLVSRVELTASELWSQPMGVPAEPSELLSGLTHSLLAVGAALLPLFALIVVTAVAANFAQIGWLFQPERLGAKFDPLGGFARLGRATSLDGWYQTAQMALQIVVVLVAAYLSIRSRLGQWASTIAADARSLAGSIGSAVFDTGLHVAWSLVALAAVDYAWRWWRHEQSLRMSDTEMREEARQSGPPRRPRKAEARDAETRPTETRQSETRQSETRQSETRQSETRQSETRSGRGLRSGRTQTLDSRPASGAVSGASLPVA